MSSPLSIPIGGTRALLQSLAPSLVPSERRVAQVCIDDSERVSEMSVSDVAKLAKVSPATVVRACQRLGFEGFQQLRELLLRDRAVRPAERTGEAGVPSQHIAEQFFGRAIDNIHGALGALDREAFDEAARKIRDCSRLLSVGNGASLAAAQSAGLQFLSSGKICECPVDIVTQHIAAKLLGPADVCLAVSDSGRNHFTLRAATLAAENGATVVAITSYGRSELAHVADLTLVAGAEFHGLREQPVIGNVVQMLLLSALHSASMGEVPGAIAAREATYAAAREMVSPPE